MSIVFEVVDLNCQAADRSFFVPNVLLTGKSTTSYATLHGFSEIVNPSSPPKKYRKATVSGFSKRVGFTAERTPRQCAGGKYVWSGTWEVDLKGNTIQKYRKDFFAQCPKQFWPPEGIQSLPGSIQTSAILAEFVAFCWPDMPQSCPTCDPDETTWPFLGNQAVGQLALDLGGFYAIASDVVATQTTFSVNVVHNEITDIITGQTYTFELFGTFLDDYAVTVGSRTYAGRVVITNPPNLVFPAVGLRAPEDPDTYHVSQYINFTDTSNHTAVLSEEYTDADAAANATVVVGTGTVAQNLPRTTGFTTVTTNVVFTLSCVNLIAGTDYTVTVDFWDQPANTHTPKTYQFTADAATHTIIDAVPTPAAGHTIAVRLPKIAFT